MYDCIICFTGVIHRRHISSRTIRNYAFVQKHACRPYGDWYSDLLHHHVHGHCCDCLIYPILVSWILSSSTWYIVVSERPAERLMLDFRARDYHCSWNRGSRVRIPPLALLRDCTHDKHSTVMYVERR